MKPIKFLSVFISILSISLILSSCNKENAIEPKELTDEEYILQVLNSGYGTNNEEDNLMSGEINDMDTSIVNDEGQPLSPIDSLIKWGRKITNASISIQNTGNDTMRYINVTREITGNYIIVGKVGGNVQTITKPYVVKLYRNIAFKRIARTIYPRLNWRVHQISCLDGGTTQPQVGSDFIQMQKIEIYKDNGNTLYATLNGPNFQNYYFNTMYFGGSGIPSLVRGEQIKVKVYLTSTSASNNEIVAYHWARNTFGFHRVPFTYEQTIGNEKVFSKSFTVYANHKLGVFNGFINASTQESLYDDDVNKFASDEIGVPYKVLQ